MQGVRRLLQALMTPSVPPYVLVLVLLAMGLSTCTQKKTEIDVSAITSAAEEVKTATEAIKSSVDEFSTSSWRDVVPQVEANGRTWNRRSRPSTRRCRAWRAKWNLWSATRSVSNPTGGLERTLGASEWMERVARELALR